eukprot:TRINITY_DN6441_c0_g1_i1.p1 TRINITY_DN6441_c0_g1~~TRINITY_DN6441_c0_g1_i1.p1  ORF type:complete len:737 (+),score=296.25 TRINITY_DN6441_c0_g1_i1:48-2213(+)
MERVLWVAAAGAAALLLCTRRRRRRLEAAAAAAAADDDIPFERSPSADADGLHLSMRAVARRSSTGSTGPMPVHVNFNEARRRLRTVLRRNCLATADDDCIALAANRAQLCTYRRDTDIVRQGSVGQAYYLIVDGQCEIKKRTEDGVERCVAVIGVEDAFGEQSLLCDSSLCNATVTARCTTRCWVIDAATYRAALWSQVVASRERYVPLLRSVPAIRTLREHDLRRVADLLEPVELGPGEVVYSDGDAGDSFYLIESGSCIVEGGVRAVLEAPEHFGADALLSGRRRLATVRAGVEGAMLARLPAASFERHLRQQEGRLAEQPEGLPPPDAAHPDDRRHAQTFLDVPDVDENDTWAGFGVSPPGADREACYRWLAAALWQLECGDVRYKSALKLVLANCRLHRSHDDPAEPMFAALRLRAQERIRQIGGEQEETVFGRLGYAGRLESLRSRQPQHDRVRQDSPYAVGPLPHESQFAGTLRAVEDVVGVADYLVSKEHVYDYVLLLLATSIDAHFQGLARGACERAGGLFRPAAVKTRQRITAKRRVDHRLSPSPQAAENLDLCRCAWCFDSPEQLLQGFAAACKVFGEPLRVKNGYAADFDALSETGGYRAVLCNFVLSPEQVQWRHFTHDPAVPERWEFLWRASTRGMTEGLRSGVFQPYFSVARRLVLSDAIATRPAALVVEVQLLTREYLSMRKRTHLWYKVARAGSPLELCMDFRT